MKDYDYWHNQGFCPAPWVSLYVDPSGRIDHCCISHTNLGYTPQENIQDILASDRNREIKHDMRYNNKLASGCSNCTVTEDVTTLRKSMLDWFKDTDKELYDNPDNFQLKYLDLRWRNTCNLACVYCGPECSSTWAQELDQQNRIDAVQLDTLKSYINDQIENLERVYLAGGEPLIIKDNEWLLQQLLERNPNVEVWVNTNLTNIDNKIFRLLMKLDRVKFIISAEAIGEQFDYIRYHGNWVKFEENFDWLRQNRPFSINNFQCVYNTLTMFNLDKFLEWAERKLDLYNRPHLADMINIVYVNSGTGSWLDPRQLTPELVIKAKEKITEWKNRFKYGGIINKLEEVESILNIPCPVNNPQLGFHPQITKLDNRRGTNAVQTFPELFEHCNDR